MGSSSRAAAVVVLVALAAAACASPTDAPGRASGDVAVRSDATVVERDPVEGDGGEAPDDRTEATAAPDEELTDERSWSMDIVFDSGWEYSVEIAVSGELGLESDVSLSPPGRAQVTLLESLQADVRVTPLLEGRAAPNAGTRLAAVWSDDGLSRQTFSDFKVGPCGWGVGGALAGAWNQIRLPRGVPGLIPNLRGGYSANQNTFAWDAFLAFTCTVTDGPAMGQRSDDLDESMVRDAIRLLSTLDPVVYVLSVTIEGYHPTRQFGTERCGVLLFADGTVSPGFRVPMRQYPHFTNDCELSGPDVVAPEALGMEAIP